MTSHLTKSPLISVVIPSYNHAQFLADAIKSVINQSYTNWELLIIDNHSSDGTDEVLAQFENPKISIIRVHNNGSIALSRNTGCAQALGEWIAFLDSDDFWSEDKLMICSTYFTPDFDLIYHDLKVFNQEFPLKTSKAINSRQVRPPIFFDLLLNGNTIATSSVVVRKSILNKVGGMREDSELSGVEDYNTWLKISRISENFKHIKMQLGTYRLHGSSITNKAKFRSPWAAVAEYLPALSEKERKAVELNFTYVTARSKFLSGLHDQSRIELWEVLRSFRGKYFFKALYMLGCGKVLSIYRRLKRK